MSNKASVVEALMKATILLDNLQRSLPGKVGQILICIDEIKEAWGGQDLEQFPFNLLQGPVDALIVQIRDEYGEDLNQTVDRKSIVYEQVVSLQHYFRISSQFVNISKVFEGIEKRYKRIDEMLPSQNYAVRDMLSDLSIVYIKPEIKQKLEVAINNFDRQDYEATLEKCTKAGEALFSLYKNNLIQMGCSGIPDQMGSALACVRKWFSDGQNKDTQGYLFTPHNRMEWFLLAMFDALHYLRNVAHHAEEQGNRIPEWHHQRRQLFLTKPEYARLALCLSFQIALELQALLAHQEELPK